MQMKNLMNEFENQIEIGIRQAWNDSEGNIPDPFVLLFFETENGPAPSLVRVNPQYPPITIVQSLRSEASRLNAIGSVVVFLKDGALVVYLETATESTEYMIPIVAGLLGARMMVMRHVGMNASDMDACCRYGGIFDKRDSILTVRTVGLA